MSNSGGATILAVVGTGARSSFVLQSASERHVVELGPINATTDFEGATATLATGLDRLASAAQLPKDAIAALPAYLGLAGVVDEDLAVQIAEALPLTRLQVEDDRRAGARGALKDRNGALVWLGTGSYFAMQSEGALRLAGGWGAALGDTASGYWIGHEALARTLDVADGLMDACGLTQDLSARFGHKTGEIVAFSRSAAPRDFAALAQIVRDAAGSGDPVACGILKGGAYYIEDTLRRMGWHSGQRLCLMGDVAPAYAPYLPLDMEASVVAPLGTAMDGALDLAIALADRAA